jgi:hypothetical protein
MTYLVACLSTGKGTWGHVAQLIKSADWEKIFLITNDFGRNTFTKTDKMEFILINPDADVPAIIESIRQQLDGKIADTEVALNLFSGSGKEHMAVLSAMLKLGLGIRLVAPSEKGFTEI